MHLGILIGLILLNGIFAMAEIALLSVRKAKLKKLAEAGDSRAEIALALNEEPTRFLSTVQIGITAIGLLNGIVGEAALSKPLASILQSFLPISSSLAAGISTTLVVLVITYVSIVLGELVPKRIAQIYADSIARFIARPIKMIAFFSRPLVFLLTISTETILRILGMKRKERLLTEEDIEAVLSEGSEAGIIEKQEHEMLQNVFALDDMPIASIMTPRSEIVLLDIDSPEEIALERVLSSDHSRYPVCHGGLQNLEGVISARRLLRQRLEGRYFDVADVTPPIFIPETLNAMQVLQQFKEMTAHMVFVVDEYGDVLGIVTLQDLLEALAGEFKTKNPDDAEAVLLEDGSWLLDGLIPLTELKKKLDIKNLPEEDKERYCTLSGLLMWISGKLLKEGEVVTWESWSFEITKLDGKRIDKVLAKKSLSED